MKYEIEIVGNDELAGKERVIAERQGDVPLLIITESAAETWAFLRRCEAERREPAEVIELRRVV